MNKIIVGNLKMNLVSPIERDRYYASFKAEMKRRKFSDTEIVLCPPAVHLESFVKKMKTAVVSIGCQNVFTEERGSYTGEVSPLMVKNIGASFLIIGHSERRRFFGETDEIANAKMKLAFKNNLTPILCVGESQEDRSSGNTFEVISNQIRTGFAEISPARAGTAIIAYEPVWAVGSDRIPTSNEILEVKILVKKIISQLYSPALAEKVRVLYGGSVKANSVSQVCLEPEMDGVLVGRESLVPIEFLKIAEIINNAIRNN